MSKAFINKTHLEGWIYEHKLEVKTTGPNSKNPGTEFISGTVSIATDNDCTNVIPVHYTYVTAITSKGKTDPRFNALKNIIDGVWKSVMADGQDNATKVTINSTIGVNDFYTDRNGEVQLVSAKRNEGGIIQPIDMLADDEKVRDTFECDMVITSVTRAEADEEKGRPEKATIKGCIFNNFSKALLPVEFSAVNPAAMDYFEGLDVSSKQPVFTKLWGRQISEVVIKTIEEESAFGEAKVREVRNTRKDWIITGASQEPYVWDDESTITVEELNKAMADRETYLADVKRSWEEYRKAQNSTSTVPTGGFNF